jgi:hypothetical protein
MYMKCLTFVFCLGVGLLSCTTSRVVPAESSVIMASGIPTEKVTYPVTVFLLERDIPPVIKRLGVVLISTTDHGVGVDRVVKRALQKKCQELGANGAYRLNEGYYPTNTLAIPYLIFTYEQPAREAKL